eukprot:612935-Amphidinium_carterae.4
MNDRGVLCCWVAHVGLAVAVALILGHDVVLGDALSPRVPRHVWKVEPLYDCDPSRCACPWELVLREVDMWLLMLLGSCDVDEVELVDDVLEVVCYSVVTTIHVVAACATVCMTAKVVSDWLCQTRILAQAPCRPNQ